MIRMSVGDLVRMYPQSGIRVGMPYIEGPAIVLDTSRDIDDDPTLMVTVLHANGDERTWYDWQLENIDG